MTDNARYLCFDLGSREFAIPLLSAKEVIGVPDVTAVPQSPAHFLGIMNLRGNVISVMDLRVKLGVKPNATGANENTVIILDLGDYNLGVVVDRVNSVQTVDKEHVSDPPVVETATKSEYITGVFRKEEKLILMLDISRALSVEDRSVIKPKSVKAA